MVHSGYEATAVMDTVTRPLQALKVSLKGVRTAGKMAPDIPLDNQRPAQYVYSRHVEIKLSEIKGLKNKPKELAETAVH